MVVNENYLGKIVMTDNYIKEVVSKTVTECFGVAGMKYTSPKEFLFSRILKKYNTSQLLNNELNSSNKLIINILAFAGPRSSTPLITV